jgi:hypothetical protein
VAANQQLYSLLFVGINGTLLAEEQSVDVKRTAAAQIVLTVAKGLAGVSPGAAHCMVDVKNAFPVGGLEFDAGPNIAGLIPVNVQIRRGDGKTIKGKCWILDDSMRHGVNQEASYEFSGIFPLSLFA